MQWNAVAVLSDAITMLCNAIPSMCAAVAILCHAVPVLRDAVPVLRDAVVMLCNVMRGTYIRADRDAHLYLFQCLCPASVRVWLKGCTFLQSNVCFQHCKNLRKSSVMSAFCTCPFVVANLWVSRNTDSHLSQAIVS